MSTPRPPDHDLERLLEADRGEFATIYDRLSRAEPPRRLDRAVLAEASRVALGPQAPRTHRWMLGLGSAAGLVLAAGIAWQVGQQREASEAVPAASPRPRASDVVPVQPISPRTPPAAEEAPPPAVGSGREAAPAAVEKKREAAQRRATAVKPAPPPAPPALAPPEASVPAPPSPAAGMPVEPLREEAEALADDAAKVAAPEPQRARDASAASDNEAAARSNQDAATGSRIRGGSRDAAAAPAPTTSVQLRNNMQRDPEDWLAEIVRLESAGRRQEAIENLRLFRRMHPEWPLGDRLRRLLE
jgi:hypothetical protein